MDKNNQIGLFRFLIRDPELKYFLLPDARFMPQLFDRMISTSSTSDADRPDTLKVGTAPDELDVERDPYGTSNGLIGATDITEEIRKNWKESLFRTSSNPNDPIETVYSFDQFILVASERQRLASLVKNTSLSTAYINQFISKSKARFPSHA